MMETLKPCPCCGGEDLIRSVDGGIWPEHLYAEMIAQGAFKKYVITCTLHCKDCGVSIQGFAESNDPAEELFYKAIEDCYGKWNHRAERTCKLERHTKPPQTVTNSIRTFFCSECGSPIYNDMVPSYCIYCGARVVE